MDQILNDFCQAWLTYDSELIFKHLADDFTFINHLSQATLDLVGYKNHINSKFEIFRTRESIYDVNILDDPFFGGKMVQISQDGNSIFYRFQISDNQIHQAILSIY